MAQNSLVFNYKKVEYPPDLSIQPISYSDPDALLSLIFGSEPIRTFHGLIQIKFTVNGKSQLFPDFDNIFPRSKSAKDWWFLAPEIDEKAIYQSDRDISTWWRKFQCIYESSILSTEELPTQQVLFLISSRTNNLVESLFNRLLAPPARISTIDEESPIYREVYSYNLFRDCGIEDYWGLGYGKRQLLIIITSSLPLRCLKHPMIEKYSDYRIDSLNMHMLFEN